MQGLSEHQGLAVMLPEWSAISAPPFTASAIRASRDPSSASAADTLIDSRGRSAIAGLW
jgi:hypothetical protein